MEAPKASNMFNNRSGDYVSRRFWSRAVRVGLVGVLGSASSSSSVGESLGIACAKPEERGESLPSSAQRAWKEPYPIRDIGCNVYSCPGHCRWGPDKAYRVESLYKQKI